MTCFTVSCCRSQTADLFQLLIILFPFFLLRIVVLRTVSKKQFETSTFIYSVYILCLPKVLKECLICNESTQFGQYKRLLFNSKC